MKNECARVYNPACPENSVGPVWIHIQALTPAREGSRCSVIRSLFCHVVGHKKLYLVITLITAKARNLNSLKER